MAMAKKCDICGALYEPYTHRDPSGISIEVMETCNSKVYKTIKTMDCCLVCMKQILNFIDDLSKENLIAEKR